MAISPKPKEKLNGYQLSRIWFDWCFENPDRITPNHSALYFFCIEHCNRLGWKDKFGLPTTMAMEAIGIKNYRTYINTLNQLIEFGFIILVEKSKNQYSSNIVAIVNFTKALDKALDKAMLKHDTKQVQSIASINKPLTNNQEHIEHEVEKPPTHTLEERKKKFYESLIPFIEKYKPEMIRKFYDHWSESSEKGKKMRWEKQPVFDISKRLATWKSNEINFSPKNTIVTEPPKIRLNGFKQE